MNLSELIINDIKPVDVGQKILLIQQMFNNLTYSHIPVSSNEDFIGCVSSNDTHCFDSEMNLEECKYAIEFFSVNENTNWLDVLEAFAQNNTNIMPVVQENVYIGYYELKDIIGLFDQTPFFFEPGAVLVISKEIKEYSFSEISQIVESNNAKILGILATACPGPDAFGCEHCFQNKPEVGFGKGSISAAICFRIFVIFKTDFL